jgi:uncharacterized protein YjbJ (UPF0337 family)
MNEDRVIGAGRDLAGKAEWAVGDAVGSNGLQADGLIDRVSGVFQNGYGQVRDAATDALIDAKPLLNDALDRGQDLIDRGQELSQQVDAAIRRRLGENGPLYVLAGAIGFLGLGLFAFSQSRGSSTPATRRTTTAKPAPARKRAATPRARKARPATS